MTNSQNETPFEMGQGINAIPTGDFLSLAFDSEDQPADQPATSTDSQNEAAVDVPAGMTDLPHPAALAAWQIEYSVSHLPFGESSRLFALVPSAQILEENENEMEENDPGAVEQLRAIIAQEPGHLSAIEQVHIPPHLVEQSLAQVAWPDDIYGVGMSTERVSIPFDPEKHTDLDSTKLEELLAGASAQDVSRVVVTVDRQGNSWCIIHPATAENLADISQGEDLVPEMVELLAQTLRRPFNPETATTTTSEDPNEVTDPSAHGSQTADE